MKKAYLITIVPVLTICLLLVIFRINIKSKKEKVKQSVIETTTFIPSMIVTPSPAISEHIIINHQYNPSWKTFTNSSEKYTIQYPPSYQIQPGKQIGKSITFLDCAKKQCTSGMSISVHDYDGSPLRAWIKTLLGAYDLSAPIYYDVTIADQNGLIVQEQTISYGSSYVLIPKKESMFLLIFPKGADKEEKSLGLIKEMMKTFSYD